MKEFFDNLNPFSKKHENNEPPPLSERYPIGGRGRREYENRRRQHERPFRVKTDPPYTGNREEEYSVQIIKVASERPANSRKRRLWLNKGQKEIDRLEARGKKLFE